MNKFLALIIVFLLQANQQLFSQNSAESKYDVKQYILDLHISNSSTEISGNVTIRAQVTATALDSFVVDLIDTLYSAYMIVDSVFINGVTTAFQHTNDWVFVPLAIPIAHNNLFSAQIYYHGNGNPASVKNYHGIQKFDYAGITQTTTHSEPNWAKIWWPCKQDLTDKADSLTFYITTDSFNRCGTNGVLTSVEQVGNGKVRYKWETKYAIDFYLVSFVVGPMSEHKTYAQLPGQDSVLLHSILFPNSSYYPIHLNAINKTKQLLYLYSTLIGTYPFKNEKYGYSVTGSALGAMEHQTMCTIGYEAFDTTAHFYSNNTYYYWYIAHELGHQWFGDYVTCGAWNHIWLNEGLASYMEYVALQHMESRESADLWMKRAHNLATSVKNGSVYIPDSLVADPKNTNDRLQYKKPAAVAHMLRYEINNDSVFFACLRNYLSIYAFSVATTDNFRLAAETTSGMNFLDFFNQWIYGQGYPSFAISWFQQGDSLIITSDQTTSSSIMPLFNMHFDLKFNFTTGGDTIVRLFQSSNHNTYKIYLPTAVSSVQFDPNAWLLHKNTVVTGIADYTNSLSCSLFPNPANDKITMTINSETSVNTTFMSIYDIHGRLLLQQPVKQKDTVFDIKGFTEGIYVCKLTSGSKTKVIKFIKE